MVRYCPQVFVRFLSSTRLHTTGPEEPFVPGPLRSALPLSLPQALYLYKKQILTEVKGDLFLVEVEGLGRLSDGFAVTEGQAIARIENEEWIVGANIASRKLARKTAQHVVKEKEALFARGLTTEIEVNNAKKALADAESSYEEGRIKVRKTKVRSPLSGVMTEVTQITQGPGISGYECNRNRTNRRQNREWHPGRIH